MATNAPTNPPRPTTIRDIRKQVDAGQKFACLTCYDATMARWMARAELPMILVGDTAAEMVLGHPQTLYADLDFMVRLTAGVRRGAPGVVLMADMPFLSYHGSERDALQNAGRFMREAGADLVKFEVDRSFAPLVQTLTRAGIPVVAHIGSKPQHTMLTGGYSSSGRTPVEADAIVEDAVALEAAGAVVLLIEATPAEVAERVVAATRVPVIGCGAGPACHGQVIVLHDLLGLTDWQPKFAPPVTNLGEQIREATSKWMDKVATNSLGDHPYRMIRSPETTSNGKSDSGRPAAATTPIASAAGRASSGGS
ncbi:MAG: 3-methyl-2-oxobutanoate hydroxymethyltransferase, partial [Planctomycetota bacterium]